MQECGWLTGTGEYERRQAEDSQEIRAGLDALRAARTTDPDDTAEDDT